MLLRHTLGILNIIDMKNLHFLYIKTSELFSTEVVYVGGSTVRGVKSWSGRDLSLQMSDLGKSPCISILIFPPSLHETWLFKPGSVICFTCALQRVRLGAKIENCVKWGLFFVFM